MSDREWDMVPEDRLKEAAIETEEALEAELETAHAQVDKLRANIENLYNSLGANPSTCRACGAPIWWIETKNGKRQPRTADALPHHADCPEAERFRKTGKRQPSEGV